LFRSYLAGSWEGKATWAQIAGQPVFRLLELVLGKMFRDAWDIGCGCIASVAHLKLAVPLLTRRKERLKIGLWSSVILSNEVTTFVDGRSSG